MGDSTPTSERDRVRISSLRSVKESFDRIRRVLNTRLSEAFDAVDKTTREPVVLWLLRFPFGVGSDEAQYFVRRLSAIAQLDGIIPNIRSFGIDGSGQPYLVYDHIAGTPVLQAGTSANDSLALTRGTTPEALFMKILRATARLHRAGWHLGDLSEDSFFLTESGDVKIVGLMGHFDTGARKTAVLPPVETLHFLAPEQRGGGIADTVTDVYALGVFGYKLFTGRYLIPDRAATQPIAGVAPAPSLVKSDCPEWLDYILGEALQTERDKRFRDAGEFLETIQNIRERGGKVPTSNMWSRSTVLVSAQDVSRSRKAPAIEVGPGEPSTQGETRAAAEFGTQPAQVVAGKPEWLTKLIPFATWAVAIGIGVAAAIGIFLNLEQGHPDGHAGGGQKIDEPPVARRPLDPAERKDVKQLLTRAVSTNAPVPERAAAFEQAYAIDPVLALPILASAALEENQERFATMLREWVNQRVPGRVRTDAGPGALVFADPALTEVAQAQLSRAVRSFSPNDAQDVLLSLLERDDKRLRGVAQEILSARILAPLRSVFLDSYLRESPGKVSPEVQRSLIRGSVGIFSEDDVVTMKRWTSSSAEPALLAACATVSDPSVALDAFDVATDRTLQLEPGASLLAWIKRNDLWDSRTTFVRPLGVLGLIDAAPDEEITAAFERLKPFTKNGLVKVLFASGHPKLIARGLDYFADKVPPREILPLLRNDDKRVRMAAVRSLKGLTDLEILQGVLRAYESEQDEEVKQLYREVHWVVRQK